MWRVYYDDGTTWDHTQGLAGMPAFGVLCILQNTVRYFVTYGAPYYALVDGEWLHFHTNDMVDYLVHGRLPDKLIVGRMVSKKTFAEVYDQAKKDKDLENL